MKKKRPHNKHSFDPQRSGAVGSRNSDMQDDRDLTRESADVVNDSLHKIMYQEIHKLPADVLKKLDVMPGLKEKLYNYHNQGEVNMLSRYLTTMDDELLKKIRDFIDAEEEKIKKKN